MSVKLYTKGEMDHLSVEKIHSYMEGRLVGIEAGKAEGHLITCNRCQRTLASIMDIEAALEKSFVVEPCQGCPEDWEIGASVRQELDSSRLQSVAEHLNTCDYCIDRAAIYYKASSVKEGELKTPREWVESAVNALKGENAPVRENAPFKRVYLTVKDAISVLPPLPGYAIAAASIALLIWTAIPDKTKVLNINSSQKITVMEAEPLSSFAFMGGEEMRAFGGMEASLDGKHLVFRWKPIDGAKGSEFILRKKYFDRDATIVTLKITGDIVIVPIEKVQNNELYEWTISGIMDDGKKFEAQAEFILAI